MLRTSAGRKYLTGAEIQKFLCEARSRGTDVFSFCSVIAHTGCRISEILELSKESFDFGEGTVIVRSLKKRKKIVFRAIPLPPVLMNQLCHWLLTGILSPDRLWPWSRMTGYRRIREVMQSAGIRGAFATPRGLRHGFAVRAVQANVPLNLVQRWLGHADVKTTTIYTHVTGPEERELASRLWMTDTEPRQAGRPMASTVPVHPLRIAPDVFEPEETGDPSKHMMPSVPPRTVFDRSTREDRQFRQSPPLSPCNPAQQARATIPPADLHGGKALLDLSSAISQKVKALLQVPPASRDQNQTTPRSESIRSGSAPGINNEDKDRRRALSHA